MNVVLVRLARIISLLMVLATCSRLEAGVLSAAETPVDSARGFGEVQERAQDWQSFFENHKDGLIAGAGALAGIILISAMILVFIVRRTKSRHGAGAAGIGMVRPGSASHQSLAEPASPGAMRGARAFPRGTAEGPMRPARSGDTARLTVGEMPSLKKPDAEVPSAPRIPQMGSMRTVFAAWTCMVVGLGIMMRSPGSYAISVPLFLIAFLLAVMAMTQRLILYGSLTLAVLYLAVPAVWLVQHVGKNSETDAMAAQAQTDSKSSKSVTTTDERSATSAPVPSPAAPVAGADPPASNPAMPRLLIPEDDALPPLPSSSAAQPVQPKEAAAAPKPPLVLPPLPAKADGALFSYRARLSHADHINPSGTDLRTLARTKFSEILLQERLHVHQGAQRDPEDTVDAGFDAHPLPEYRSLFEGKPLRMPSNVSLIQMLKDDVILDVQVFEKFIQVDPVSAQQNP
jgi:hypothetical protein